jgi:hypothetical protein
MNSSAAAASGAPIAGRRIADQQRLVVEPWLGLGIGQSASLSPAIR